MPSPLFHHQSRPNFGTPRRRALGPDPPVFLGEREDLINTLGWE
jgi:hypothetical protein